jgi:hypothetical protein
LAESDVRVLDRGAELCAIVTAEPGNRPGAEIKLSLRARGINTSSPGRDDAVIDMDAKHATSAIRISPHYYNTAREIDTASGAWSAADGAPMQPAGHDPTHGPFTSFRVTRTRSSAPSRRPPQHRLQHRP